MATSRYLNLPTGSSDSGTKYYLNAIYPEIDFSEEDIYVVTTAGDRYDKLALQFYANSSYWWIIAAANALGESDSITVTPGTQIRIPAHPEQYRRDFELFNAQQQK